MKYTANYNLKKPEGTDTVNIDDFNNNADVLDTEINSINEQIDTLTIQDDSLREQINNLGAHKADLVDGKVPSNQLPNIETPVQSVNGKTGAVVLTKSNVGLGNADNTADSTKAVLSATKLATPKAINGVNFDGTAPITIADNTKAPTNHASTGTSYGVGTEVNYGHNKVINNLTRASFVNGEALAAYQGKVLNDSIYNKSAVIYEGTSTAENQTICTFDIRNYKKIFGCTDVSSTSFRGGFFYDIYNNNSLIGAVADDSSSNSYIVKNIPLITTPVNISSSQGSVGNTSYFKASLAGNIATITIDKSNREYKLGLF